MEARAAMDSMATQILAGEITSDDDRHSTAGYVFLIG